MIKYLVIINLLCSYVLAAEKNAIQTSLSSESDDQASLVSLVFKGKASKKETVVEEHGTFIQVKIPDTIVAESGKFYDGNSPFIRKIALFQVDDTTAGVRLFVTQETDTIIPALSTEKLNDRYLIHIDHSKVKVPHIDDSPPVEKIIAKTEVRKNITDPAKILTENKKKEGQSNAHQRNEIQEISSRIHKSDLENIAIMLAAIIPLMILGVVIRKIMSRTMKPTGTNFPMKTLASYSLAPKQNLTLVEVGKERILLGVSPDGINFLTSISKDHDSQNPSVGQTQRVSETNVRSQLPKARLSDSSLEKEYNRQKVLKKSQIHPSEPTRSEDFNAGVSKNSRRDKNKLPSNDSYNRLGSRKTLPDNNSESRSIEDVTNLIRSKLKDLPNI